MAKKTKSKPLPSGTRYSTYVRRSIEKQKSEMVDFQKLTISANALTAADQLIDHFIDVLTQNAGICTKYTNNNTLQYKHAHAGAKVTMSGRLAEKSIRAGVRAVTRFNQADDGEKGDA